jgi:hypothetical protein
MPSFLLLSLSAEPIFTYHQPLLAQVKQAAPGWAALDVDSFSDEILVGYAARLVREADLVVAVFKAEQPGAPLGACQQVLEEIIRLDKPAVIFLQGEHRRLKAIFQARPHFTWHEAATGVDLQHQFSTFLNEALTQPE